MRVMVPYQASWMADFPCYVADDCKFEVKVLVMHCMCVMYYVCGVLYVFDGTGNSTLILSIITHITTICHLYARRCSHLQYTFACH